MIKKVIALLMIAAILCGMLVGCGKDETSTDPSTSSNPGQTSSTPADDSTGDPTNDSVQPSGTDTASQDSMPSESDGETTIGTRPGSQDEPSQTEGQDTKPQQGIPTETTGNDGPIFPEATDSSAPESDEVTFLEYHAMSGEEQKAFINNFDSIDAFVAWHTAAKQAYEDSLVGIDGTTPIDLEDILGDN